MEVHQVDKEDQIIGTGKTDASGAWDIARDPLILVTDYYAVALKKKIRKKHGRRLICKEGISPTVQPF